tara:strand:- start:147 stop:548 length:402 start_codon:yes stop_codon:yes gene_type:complete
MAKNKIECPKCNRQPTGKYRDEMRIDGMYCKPCNVAWNVDWENRKPLYETVEDIVVVLGVDVDNVIGKDPRDSGIEKEWDNKSDAEQIEEILLEANAYSLREEVKREAKKLIKNDPDLNEAVAYEMALMNWVK